MQRSLIVTPEVMAAFSRAKAKSEIAGPGAQGKVLHACSIRDRARACLFWASRAFAALFGGLVRFLDDLKGIHVQDFATVSLHGRLSAPNSHNTFLLIFQGMRASRSKTHADIGNRTYQVATSDRSDTGRRWIVGHIRDAVNDESPWSQQPDAGCLEASVRDCNDNRDSGCNKEIVNEEENDELEKFPDYVDCSCLSCQGYEVTEVLWDQHNSESPSDDCKLTAVTCINHSFRPVKENEGVELQGQTVETLLSHSQLLDPLQLPAALSIAEIETSEEEPLINKPGGGTTALRYNSDTKDHVLNASRLCEMLAATRHALQQQLAELQTQIPGS